MKKFLAFDASGDMLIVGCYNGEKYFERREIGGGTERLLPMIDAVLRDSGVTINDIEVVCVGVGPGSWTGSRVSVVTGYGLGAGNSKLKFAKFNAFDLISYNGNENKRVVKLVKAFANFVYVQDYQGEILAITKDELKDKYKNAVFVSSTKIVDEAIVCTIDLENVARKLVENNEFLEVELIEPIYLRKSQAEYQFDERMKKNGV